MLNSSHLAHMDFINWYSTLSSTCLDFRYNLMSWCNVSHRGTHSMSPEFDDRGTTAKRVIDRSPWRDASCS